MFYSYEIASNLTILRVYFKEIPARACHLIVLMSSLWTGNRVHGMKALTTHTIYDKTLIIATTVYNFTDLLMVPIKYIDMYSIASNKYETYSTPSSYFDIRHSK